VQVPGPATSNQQYLLAVVAAALQAAYVKLVYPPQVATILTHVVPFDVQVFKNY
jgi:hypothetical protein